MGHITEKTVMVILDMNYGEFVLKIPFHEAISHEEIGDLYHDNNGIYYVPFKKRLRIPQWLKSYVREQS